MPSSRIRTVAPSGESRVRPTTSPAANAPRTKSRPTSVATRDERPSKRIDARTAAWPVVCTVSCRTRSRRGGRARRRCRCSATITRRTRRRSSTSSTAPYAPVRKIEMTTIGQNSPAMPAAEHGGSERRRQQAGVGRGSGRACPSAVVLRATPSSHHSASTPASLEHRARRRGRSPARRAQPAVPRTTERAARRVSRRPRARRRRRAARGRSSRGTRM